MTTHVRVSLTLVFYMMITMSESFRAYGIMSLFPVAYKKDNDDDDENDNKNE